LPVVLYGHGTWSQILREEHRLRVYGNRVLRIIGPSRDKVTGEWGKLHNEKLNDLYCSPNIVQVIKWTTRWAGHVASMGEGREAMWSAVWYLYVKIIPGHCLQTGMFM
jgi:hypothetical protein